MAEAVSKETRLFRLNLGSRISHCIEIIGKKGEAAEVAHITTEQLNKWAKGEVKVPVEGLRHLAVASGVDFSWLATGQGVAPYPRPIQFGDPAVQPSQSEVPIIRLPMYDIEASAGIGLPVGPEVSFSSIAFEPRFLRAQGARPEQCSVISTSGDSMQPVIPDGSLLVVDHSQTEIRNGHIMVIAVGDDLMVKRIRRRLDGLVELISDNPAYPPEVVGADRLDQLRVIGRVVYFCRVP